MIKLETFSFIDYIFNSVLQFGGALHFLFARSTRFFEQFYVTSLINSFITLTPTMYVVLCQLTRKQDFPSRLFCGCGASILLCS